MRRYSWSEQSLCKEQTDLFFAPDGETPKERIAREHVAKSICADCPVTSDCLDAALKGDERGIWGGTTESERRRLYRRVSVRRTPLTGPRPTRPPQPAPEWRTITERPNTLGLPVRIAISENGAGWHGFGYAVYRGDDLAFLADDEAEAWIYFQTLVVT